MMMERGSDFGAREVALNSAANDLVRRLPLRSRRISQRHQREQHSITPAENGHSKKWREERSASILSLCLWVLCSLERKSLRLRAVI